MGPHHVYGPGGEALYMAPPDPPRSIYGTLPRSTGDLVASEASLPAHYATFRRERLGPKVSLKLKQMMKTEEAQDTMSIMSGFTESGSGTRDPPHHLAEVFYQRVTKDPSDIAADSLEIDAAMKDNLPGDQLVLFCLMHVFNIN